jgi:cell pole-organizing protein PopZ
MSTADKSAEASMDDILASIRQLIADDSTSAGDPARASPEKRQVFPRLDTTEFRQRTPQSSGAAASDGRLLPPADRFSNSLRPPVPAPTAAVKPQSLAQALNYGLDDLLDDGGAAAVDTSFGAEQQPAPIVSVAPLTQAPFAAPSESVAPANASTSVETNVQTAKSAGGAPQFESAARLEADAPIISGVAATSTGGDPWASWRSLRVEAPASDVGSAVTIPTAAPVIQSYSELAQKRGFYPPPPPSAKPTPPPTFASTFPRPTVVVASTESVSANPAPTIADAKAADAKKLAAEQVSPATEKDALVVPRKGSAEPVVSQLNGTAHAGPVSPTLASQSQKSVSDKDVAQSVTDALDQLAAGLAVASTANPSLATVTSADQVAVVAAPVTTVVTPANPLEGMVADMLRPMLEKWIETNMPRILQKALEDTGKKSG